MVRKKLVLLNVEVQDILLATIDTNDEIALYFYN